MRPGDHIILAYYEDDFTIDEIAKRLGRSINTVRKVLKNNNMQIRHGANAQISWKIHSVARALCRAAYGSCVMDERPQRSLCTTTNCRMMPIAKAALKKATKG
jgi:transposase